PLPSPRTNPGADLASPRAGARRPRVPTARRPSRRARRGGWRPSAGRARPPPPRRPGAASSRSPPQSRPPPRPAPREPRSPESRRVPTWRRGFHPNWPPAGPSGRTPRLAGTGCSNLLQLECTARNHEQRALRVIRKHAVHGTQNVTKRPGELVGGHDAQANLVADDDPASPRQLESGLLGAGADFVVRVTGSQEVGDPQREAVDDHEAAVRSCLNGSQELERLFSRRPAGRTQLAMPADAFRHLAVLRCGGGDHCHRLSRVAPEAAGEVGLAAPRTPGDKDEPHQKSIPRIARTPRSKACF